MRNKRSRTHCLSAGYIPQHICEVHWTIHSEEYVLSFHCGPQGLKSGCLAYKSSPTVWSMAEFYIPSRLTARNMAAPSFWVVSYSHKLCSGDWEFSSVVGSGSCAQEMGQRTLGAVKLLKPFLSASMVLGITGQRALEWSSCSHFLKLYQIPRPSPYAFSPNSIWDLN